MLTPWRIYCEGERLRGVVKHSWLENQVECTGPEDAAEWSREDGGWSALEAEFPVRLRQADQLAQNIADLFSPVQLIDRCVAFGKLDEATNERFRQAVHQAYLESSEIEVLRQPLLVSVARLREAINAFRARCSAGSGSNGDAEALALWEQVVSAATELRKLLEQIPKGVVLP